MGTLAMALLIIAILLLVAAGVCLVILQLAARSIQRTNRVSPSVPTQAPLLWRWSIGISARHHRRLQRVAALARACAAAAGPGGIGIADLATDLELQACGLDDQLALCRHLPTSQRVRKLFELNQAIAEVERLAFRVTLLAGQMTTRPGETTAPIAERIGHLEQAMAEVRRIEAEALGETRALGQATGLPLPVTRVTDPAPLRRPRR